MSFLNLVRRSVVLALLLFDATLKADPVPNNSRILATGGATQIEGQAGRRHRAVGGAGGLWLA